MLSYVLFIMPLFVMLPFFSMLGSIASIVVPIAGDGFVRSIQLLAHYISDLANFHEWIFGSAIDIDA